VLRISGQEVTMEHISAVLARLSPQGAEKPPGRAVPVWRRAAEAAHRIARQRATQPASLPQLLRVCQLLTSHVVEERERRRAYRRLVQGCTRSQASAMLDYLIPVVRARRAAEAERPPASP
jgi:hypothetical protein